MSADLLVCGCLHDAEEHANGRGKCGGLDSYGVPCECPSYVDLTEHFRN